MDKIMGWPTMYFGNLVLSAGAWIQSGPDVGLITGGICLIVFGFIQLSRGWWK